jgi:hypothetical protein
MPSRIGLLASLLTAPVDPSVTLPPPNTGFLEVTGPALTSDTGPLRRSPVTEPRTEFPLSRPALPSCTLPPLSRTGPLPVPTFVLRSRTGPLSWPTGPPDSWAMVVEDKARTVASEEIIDNLK